ncbi:NAD(P)/FAD-dependent oxidoreductase, partial [Myxococcota bacterium]|nr:NAD(P)/FAD-dependent oxidoreductase [Myxococcota bacterium]
MSESRSLRPITEDREFIRSALAEASIPTLLATLVHLTGDVNVLNGPIRPEAAVLGDTSGGIGAADSEKIRQRALNAFIDYRDAGCPPLPTPPPEIIHQMMSFVVGQEVPDRYVPMMLEELSLGDSDLRGVNWSGIPAETRQNFHVAVIGAGMSGLLTAIQLGRAGIPYTVFEKNESVGGTWYENSYPGCRVDIGNHFYCYSFEPNPEWSEYFAQQPELNAYFEHCTDKYNVRDQIRFNTEIIEARFQDSSCDWELTFRTQDGEVQKALFQAVISAVGQLNRPRVPEIPGLDHFGGACFHSACWNHEYSLQNQKVALVGTGASAFQIGPELAKIASHLSVFQRSPAWMFPNPDYHRTVEDGKQWLLAHVPFYARWYRFLLFWPGSDGLMPSLIVDPDWPHPERSVNALNEEARLGFTEYIESQLTDSPDLIE